MSDVVHSAVGRPWPEVTCQDCIDAHTFHRLDQLGHVRILCPPRAQSWLVTSAVGPVGQAAGGWIGVAPRTSSDASAARPTRACPRSPGTCCRGVVPETTRRTGALRDCAIGFVWRR